MVWGIECISSIEASAFVPEEIFRASIDATYRHVPDTEIGLMRDPGVFLKRLTIGQEDAPTRQLFVLGTSHTNTASELSLVQGACRLMFGSPDMTLENPSLIVEERERNPDMGSSDEYTFQKEGEIAVVEKYFRGTTGKRVLSFGLDPGTWTALANKYGVERARKYVQYRLGPQWSAIPDSERPTLDQYFAEALGRYPEITMSLPNNYPVSTVRRLSELVLKVSDVMEPADRRYLAEWLRRQTIAPYALREKEAKLTPMQYFSIIVNKERAMALLRTTLQELRSGHDVCIAGGELHGVTTTEAIDRAQGELGWHVIQEDLALVA